MRKLAILFSLAALLAFAACEKRETAQSTQEPSSQQPAVSQTQPGEQSTATQQEPASREQTASTEAKPSTQESPATAQQAPPATSDQAASQQPAASGQKDEFLGQSPKFENAPETITLQAKNGNVTLPHKSHAEKMECKTCHGDATPGKMPDFAKDKAHQLCQGCHKEKGAGPTKCPDCHKK